MRPRSRILLALTTVVVLAFALVVILDRPATRSPAGAATNGTSMSVAEHASSSGFDGALLPGKVRAPDFTLTDQRGRRVSLGQYRGRVTILTFLSSACPPTCPLVAQQIRGALDELGGAGGHPIPTLIVSADPAADTPAAVRRFLGEAALTGRVEYLTGARAQLQPIWRAYNVVPAQLGNANSPHPAAVLVIDRGGQERDLFQVEQLTPEALAHDIRKLQGGT
ncbi:MAG TPA: SCO family protein [Solirubrobacteraceae bacterium]